MDRQAEDTIRVVRADAACGARITGVDVAAGLTDLEFCTIERALYENGVVAIGGQSLTAEALALFAARFGQIYRNPTSPFRVQEQPEIMILSNKRTQDGKQIGAADAGQGWHTDMSYTMPPGKITILHGVEIPHRDGKALGDTLFASMYAAYEALPTDLKQEIEGAVGLHDFHKFYDMMIARGSGRPPLTDEQRRARPPVKHPLVGTHPVSGRKFLYADPGYVTDIIGFTPDRSQAVLDFLIEFQTQEQFIYRHHWQVGDVLIWDNLATIHSAVADYNSDEPRYMLRAQVVGDMPLAA